MCMTDEGSGVLIWRGVHHTHWGHTDKAGKETSLLLLVSAVVGPGSEAQGVRLRVGLGLGAGGWVLQVGCLVPWTCGPGRAPAATSQRSSSKEAELPIEVLVVWARL